MIETDKFNVLLVNDGKTHEVPFLKRLGDFSEETCKTVKDAKTGVEYPVLAALVDNKLKELDYRMVVAHEVEFIGYNHPDGRRTYLRSLCFVLQNAIRKVFPDKVLIVDHSLPSGLYCTVNEPELKEDGRRTALKIDTQALTRIKEEMHSLVERDLPFRKEKMACDKAERLFLANHQPDKAELLKSLGEFICSVYFLDGQVDTFHGPLLPSTGYLKVFDIVPFAEGFCLQFPCTGDFDRVIPVKSQSKIAATLAKYSDWCSVIRVNGIGTLNSAISNGQAINLINMAESLHERNYAAIADQIYAQRDRVKAVFIAGPSSSGKTSSSLRIALQCRVLGLVPKVIELDNYFVDRDKTPRDEQGNYDFEALEAMDVAFLNEQLSALLRGEEVEIPKFDFKEGHRRFEGNKCRLEAGDMLFMEGIHALNPALTPAIPQNNIFRIYISALSSLPGGEKVHNSTTDKRLLRRIVRDNRTRGISPEDNILRWPSVRRGEDKYIFPYEENADVVFNSSTLYDLPLLKYYAAPLLCGISESSPAYEKATELLDFLKDIVCLKPFEIAAIPPTSIMREFIGGQTLV